MTEFYISMHSINDVKEFVTAASLTPVDIDVVSGRYTIDGKSILGLFSLSQDTPMLVRVYGDPKDGDDFRSRIPFTDRRGPQAGLIHAQQPRKMALTQPMGPPLPNIRLL